MIKEIPLTRTLGGTVKKPEKALTWVRGGEGRARREAVGQLCLNWCVLHL